MSVKMSLGEAIVRFLDNQYVSLDGREEKFAEGFFTIFGHGCVLGVGEALSMAKHALKVYQGKNEQGRARLPRTISRCFSSAEIRSLPVSPTPCFSR